MRIKGLHGCKGKDNPPPAKKNKTETGKLTAIKKITHLREKTLN